MRQSRQPRQSRRRPRAATRRAAVRLTGWAAAEDDFMVETSDEDEDAEPLPDEIVLPRSMMQEIESADAGVSCATSAPPPPAAYIHPLLPSAPHIQQ
eukprot:SAG11_NODE_25571_length_357_cov_0.581395_1_plen_97_part_00